MASNQESSSSIIPQPNDVLLGRGSGTNDWVGNVVFRNLVEEYKKDYVAAVKHSDKKRIAQELLDHVDSLGGRFLRQSEEKRAGASSFVEGCVWHEVERGVAHEKCKQALREKTTQKKKKKPAKKVHKQAAMDTTDSEIGIATDGCDIQKQQKQPAKEDAKPKAEAETSLATDGCETADEVLELLPLNGIENVSSAVGLGGRDDSVSPSFFDESAQEETPVHSSNFTSILPSPLAANPAVDATLQLFQPSPVVSSAQFSQTFQSGMIGRPQDGYSPLRPGILHNGQPAAITSRHQYLEPTAITQPSQQQYPVEDSALSSPLREPLHQPLQSLGFGSRREELNARAAVAPVTKSAVHGDLEKRSDCNMNSDFTPLPQETMPKEEVGEFLLSIQSLSNRKTISEQQLAKERASLSDEEKNRILSDLFGDMRLLDSRPEKRARRVLDPDSIEFLVRQMRLELERIPNVMKQALVEAQSKCHPEEFSDERFVTFLRCEGMNAKLAAQRFVNYWECRREVFGSQKYVMRMTLAEALRDDLVALEAGLICRLPHLDLSGRQIIYAEPSRHTRHGYTSESMQRALWYTIETVAKDANNNVSDGRIVQVLWDANTTMFDYDKKVNDRLNYFRCNAWPVRLVCLHDCCPPKFVVRVLKPILMALKTKSTRHRTLFHDVPASEILDTLAGYGILKGMVPTEMGGTVVLNQQEWIANRWAAELEEI